MTATTHPVALVTGGGRGIGRGIALRLARDGGRVAIAARSREQVDNVAREIVAAGGSALAVACDVTQQDDVRRAVAAVTDRFGPISLLVNNAGVGGPIGPIGEIDAQAWWQAQTVHVFGAMLCMSEVIPNMLAAGGGRILNICSQAGTFVAPFSSAYSVAKATLIRLTEHVDAERREQGIRAFPIQPGTIITDLARETLAAPAARKWAAPLIALLESITPEDSARAMARLQDFVADLARGRWDALSGRFLDVGWDLEAMLRDGSGNIA